MITAIMIQNAGMVSGASTIVILIAVLGIGFLIGCMSGAFVVVLKMAPFVATLATMTIIRGAAYMTSNGQPHPRLSSEHDTSAMMVKFGSQGIPGIALPWPVVLIIAVIVLMWLVMRNTVFGRLVIASGSNETAVRLAGINVNKYKFFAYAICGMLCALGGIILTSRVAVASPAVSTGMELDAIAACVIGGASLMGGKRQRGQYNHRRTGSGADYQRHDPSQYRGLPPADHQGFDYCAGRIPPVHHQQRGALSIEKKERWINHAG